MGTAAPSGPGPAATRRRPRDGDPLGTGELAGLFAEVLEPGDRAVLAVSGGCDSTALMVLFADWLADNRRTPAQHTVVTVDHRLRPASASEARIVARHATALGFGHHTLVWDGVKPSTGLQAAARAARYRLLAGYARERGFGAVMTGHTADDQAETLLMRLARGSGIDGLAAMAPATVLADDGAPRAGLPEHGQWRMRLLRPLLAVPRARLRATLESRAIAWQEDPSNGSPAFERARMRAAAGTLAALGLTRDSLALSARRLQRARAALERAVDAFCEPRAAMVTTAPSGFVRFGGAALRDQPREIAIRALLRAVAAVGGGGGRVSLAKLEAVAEGICARECGAWTLARTKITATPASVLIVREAGRTPPPRLALAAGQEALWDGRFLVRAAGDVASVEVRALGPDGVRAAAAAGAACPAAPPGVLEHVPAFYRDGLLIAVPSLGYWVAPELRSALTAIFAPICSCNIATAADAPRRSQL